jgi:pilus assembly protein Flp/PilA
MTSFRRLSNIIRNVRGTSSVEYGIILGMIVLVVFLALEGLATETIGMWDDISTKSSNAINGK